MNEAAEVAMSGDLPSPERGGAEGSFWATAIVR
jgi:hypothetical protein